MIDKNLINLELHGRLEIQVVMGMLMLQIQQLMQEARIHLDELIKLSERL